MVSDFNRIPEAKAAIRFGTQKALASTVQSMDDKIQEGFSKGQTATGASWAQLAPSTIMAKGHSDPLIEHGNLQDSFQTSVDDRKMEASIFTEDPKAAFHEFGTPDLPRRPFLRPAATWAENNVVTDTFSDTLNDELRRVTI